MNITSSSNNEVYGAFEDIFLYDGKKQLKMHFNPKVTSFKNTILETRTNTIGNKYPFTFRNKSVYYKEFPINGLLSYYMDEEELLVVSHAGMAIRFTTKDINPIGRVAAGVKSIKLGEGDYVVAGLPIHKATDMLAVITENGMGKKIQLNEFSTQGRNGKGVIVSKDTVAGVAMVDDEDTLLLVGQPTSICFETKELPVLGRAAAGNIVIKNSKVKRVVKF